MYSLSWPLGICASHAGTNRFDDITSYLAYYNTERRHSALDYLSPHQFESLHNHP
jgi:transposase InsO family protein